MAEAAGVQMEPFAWYETAESLVAELHRESFCYGKLRNKPKPTFVNPGPRIELNPPLRTGRQ
ncbi:MAG: hypothetical protein ABJF23_03395 [Bryobacteraceae bacterium]